MHLLEKLKEQKEELRLKKSLLIKEKLFSQREFLDALTVMFYISKNGEVDTTRMIQETLKSGKRTVVPVTLVKEKKIIPSELKDYALELDLGPYGILQPKPEFVREIRPEEIDLVLVPGVAFDQKGNRLGRGGGYFDRFLRIFRAMGKPLLGLAFDFQMLEKLPVLDHDIPVTRVITA